VGIVICDIDGTLADLTHRRHFVEGGEQDWDSFFYPYNVMQDKPKHDIIELVDTLSIDSEIWLFTGRPEKLRETTEEWLDKYGICRELLWMRPDGDYQSDVWVKWEMFNRIDPKVQKQVWLVLDDRDRLVKMWRHEFGLTCLQVADGNF